MSNNFGPVRQLGYVVQDIDRAIEHWTINLGVGPFFLIEDQPLKMFAYRGERSEPSCRIALAQSGAIQVELIEQRNDAPSAFKEFSDQGHEGLQHLGFWTTNFDRHERLARELGMTELQRGQSGSGSSDERFIYFTHRGHRGTVVELSEVVGRKGSLFRAVELAAAQWDGADPVRPMDDLVLR
jgi:hypothetical protein